MTTVTQSFINRIKELIAGHYGKETKEVIVKAMFEFLKENFTSASPSGLMAIASKAYDEVEAEKEAEMFKANFKAAVAYVSGEIAQDQIEFRGKWLTDNAFAFDGGGISVVLYEKKEAWYDIEDAGLRPLGNVEMFKEQVNEYLARVRK